jgi:hypothetical protein
MQFVFLLPSNLSPSKGKKEAGVFGLAVAGFNRH